MDWRRLITVRQARRATLWRMLDKKNGGKVPCYVCGEHVRRREATLEHIVPLSKGGTDDMDNLSISHAECNQKKGDSVRLSYPPKKRKK